MRRWPCSSAKTLRIDASGPGWVPLIAADTVRSRSRRRSSPSMWIWTSALPQPRVGDAVGPGQRDQVRRGRAPTPQDAAGRQRDPLVGQRDLGQVPAPVLLPHQVLGRDADLVEEDLVEEVDAGHLHDRADLDAGGVHRADEVRDPPLLRGVGVGAGDEDAELGDVGDRGPDLLAVDDVGVPVPHGRRAQRSQVGAGAGLAEELAPELLARRGSGTGSGPSAPGSRRRAAWARPSRCRSGSAAGARRRRPAPRR